MSEAVRILLIAPLPPPITGQALASRELVKGLSKNHSVRVVDLSKNSFRQGISSWSRIVSVLNILRQVRMERRSADVVYLTISQSIAGNMKDVLLYVILRDMLSRTVIHLHGGGIGKLIFEKYGLLRSLNKIFLKRLGAVVVLGESLRSIFEGMTPADRIHVVPNFAEDEFFMNSENIREKYSTYRCMNILFCSNLIEGKGYRELVDAYKDLDVGIRKEVRIDFAGDFESEGQRHAFLDSIKNIHGIRYHGIAADEQKRRLFAEAHVFCLPTYYPYYEGQPISILEAYASGCVVITTDHGGICDIFKDGINGFQVVKGSSSSIRSAIEDIHSHPEKLPDIALLNRTVAERMYTLNRYQSDLSRILETVSGSREYGSA